MRLNIGSIARNNFGWEILVSPDYEVFRVRSEAATSEFVNQLRYSSYWTGFMKRAGAGSVRVRIYFADLARLRVPAPELAEQRRIAEVLELLDSEMDQMAQLRKWTERQKRGLLSSLLSEELSVPA
jgi:type I restriction enzyme S subunit